MEIKLTIKQYKSLSQEEQHKYRPVFKQRKVWVEDICDECGSLSKYQTNQSYGRPIGYRDVDEVDLIIEDMGESIKKVFNEYVVPFYKKQLDKHI